MVARFVYFAADMKNLFHFNRRQLAILVLASVPSLSSPLNAQVQWAQTSGTNDYSTGANWAGGSVPATNQTAAFSANGTQTVQFSATPVQPQNLTVGIDSGTLTFNSVGASATLVQAAGNITLGTSSNADIIIQKTGAGNFTFRSASSFNVGGAGAHDNTVTVKGTNVTAGSSSSIVIVGVDNSSGNTLNVQDGAKLVSFGGTIGRANNSDNNKIRLTGAGTLWEVTGNPASANITLGVSAGNDNNDLIVENGAKVSSSVPLNVYRGTVHLDSGEIDLTRSTAQALTFQAAGRLRGQGILKASKVSSTAAGAIVEVGENGFGVLNATLTDAAGWNNTNITLQLGIGDMTGTPVAGTDYDWLNIDGSFTFGGSLTIDLTNALLPGTYDFALINWTNSVGVYSNMTVNFINGSPLDYEYRSDGFYIIPEPGVTALLIGGLGAIMLGLRRRKNNH